MDKPIERSLPVGKGDVGALSWTEELRRVALAVSKKDRGAAAGRQQLFYLLQWTADLTGFGVTVHKGREPESAAELWNIDRALAKTLRFVSDEDRPILRLLWTERAFDTGLHAFGIGPRHGGEALQLMARTGRLCRGDDFSFLTLASPRPATLSWREAGEGRQMATLLAEPAASLVIPLPEPWFVDLERRVVGPLQVRGNPAVVARLFSLPPLSATAAALVGEALAETAIDLPSDPEQASVDTRCIVAEPVAVLRLRTLQTHGNRGWRDYSPAYGGGPFDVALATFRYEDVEVIPDDRRDFSILANGEMVRIERQRAREEELMAGLAKADLEKIPGYVVHTFGRPPDNAYGLARESSWPLFMREQLGRLRSCGWQIDFANEFRHRLLEVEAWDADLTESGHGWFELDMGIVVEGERLPLAPLLASLFRRDGRWLEASLLALVSDGEMVELVTAAGLRIRVPAWRLKPLAATLIDLFEGFTGGSSLRLSRFDAPRLSELNDSARWRFRGQNDVLALAEQLNAAQAISHIAPPRGLGLELRHYQTEGLAWLQFLREQNLAGILADDMGLGKTAQTLAHLLLEKESGRLDRPALIVLPTSLIFNWTNEAARFAPGLSLLSLHGPERKNRFADIPLHDVVLTTYPLLWRDVTDLTRHAYHLLILDEAQTVKNARSQGAEVVRRIDARHRLCLTGTPLENHLGELWSQFDFLLPGFLGSNQTFTRYWRA